MEERMILKYALFYSAKEVPEFVNRALIKRENIEAINP
jgi:hypothetical protein